MLRVLARVRKPAEVHDASRVGAQPVPDALALGVKAPAGRTVEWDAEVTEDRPDEAIGWKAAEGADIENSGTVRFEPGPAGRGTVVRVRLRYRPPAGALGAAVAKLFGEEPRQQAQEDLRRFKRVMEIGEVPTTEGQPAGRRSSVARLFAKVSP